MVYFNLVLCLLGFVPVILHCAGLVGVCLILVVFGLCCLTLVLFVLLSLWLMGVWLARWVAGLKELEEFGRECDLPRKRMVLWLVDVVFPMFFMVLGGRGFVLVMSFWVFGAHDDKRGRFSSDERVSFPREGVG